MFCSIQSSMHMMEWVIFNKVTKQWCGIYILFRFVMFHSTPLYFINLNKAWVIFFLPHMDALDLPLSPPQALIETFVLFSTLTCLIPLSSSHVHSKVHVPHHSMKGITRTKLTSITYQINFIVILKKFVTSREISWIFMSAITVELDPYFLWSLLIKWL